MIFLRHPVTEAAPGLCYGRMDLGLGAEAPGQIETALRTCPRILRITSSPARRCRELAEAIATRDEANLTFDTRLWEMDFGDWEGLLWSEIPRDQSDPWAEDFWNIAPPGGETFREVHARVSDALSEIVEGTVVIAHGGVIRAAKMIREGASLDEIWNCQIPFATPIPIERKAA
ncbi:MAG: histidine phosphatase family protein [Pseudomonadota bacterium]